MKSIKLVAILTTSQFIKDRIKTKWNLKTAHQRWEMVKVQFITCLAIPKSASFTSPPLSTRIFAPFISLDQMIHISLLFSFTFSNTNLNEFNYCANQRGRERRKREILTSFKRAEWPMRRRLNKRLHLNMLFHLWEQTKVNVIE